MKKLLLFFKKHKIAFIKLARECKYINDIECLQKELKIKKGQLLYVLEYLKKHPCKFVKQGDLLLYCDKRRYEDTKGEKPNFKDNSRAVETLRKDRTPLRWLEVTKNNELYFMYCKELEKDYIEEVVRQHATKKQYFSKEVVKNTFQQANFKCEMCGISATKVKLECDHWVPRKTFGESSVTNAVCLCSNCNPKKNSCSPSEWFCKHFVYNFHKLSLKSSEWEQNKIFIINYINNLS